MTENIEVYNGPLRIEDDRLVQVISDIEITSPKFPILSKISGAENYLVNPFACKWERPIAPDSLKYIKFDKDGNIISEIDEELEAFIEEEWRRRREGYWFMVYCRDLGKAIPMYITGTHYLYLTYWTLDTGYPEFRDNDRRWFWFIKFCEEDPFCLGDIVIDRRQEGKSAKAGVWIYDRTTKGKMRHGGIQSKTGPDANSFFSKFVIRGWRRLPFFFSPKFDGSNNPRKKLDFTARSVKGRQAVEGGAVNIEEELGGLIEARASNELAFDGESLFTYIGDEEGKTDLKEANVEIRWDVVKQGLLYNGKVRGKSHHTSTAEFMEKGGSKVYKKMWKGSCYADKDAVTKMTTSGLYRYFKPAFDGYLFDDWGFSLIEESRIALQATFDQEKDPHKRYALKRKNPFTVADAFRSDGSTCAFNIIKLQERIEYAGANPGIWQPFNLEWEQEIGRGGIISKIDTRVVAKPSEGGRFWFKYLPIHESNNVQRRWDGVLIPKNNDKFSLAIDPYDAITVKNPDPSNGAITGFRKYDILIDPENKPVEEWETNKFFFYYCARPAGGPDIFYEDMVLATHFLGCEALIEKNKWGLYNYFLKRGRGEFISTRPESSFGVTKEASDKEEKGIDSTILVKNAYFEKIDQYIEDYYMLCDCLPILDNWLSMEFENMTPYDLGVSSGLNLLQVNKYIRPQNRTQSGKSYVRTYKKNGNSSVEVK